MCVRVCVCFPVAHREKVKDVNRQENKKSLCVCVGMCRSAHSLLPAFCSCVLMFLALRELLSTSRSAGVVLQRKKEVKY